ncbi:MAG TPA: SMP-30/gluconolactonase/LRE family protein [Abditibacteriaceae bacterium]|jgi:sugar lactone lactonase YvrE/enterochelin esterase-like enzyme
MKKIIALAALLLIAPLHAATDYPLTEDSKSHDNVPKGEILKFTFDKSKVFPGTTREYNVYVPRQYDGIKPACVYVNQDGIQWNAPTVFDNLIAKGEMPITIGVFVRPGVVNPPNDKALPRFNRSFEYDGLGDSYARFLIEELLPEVETKKTADGRAIVLSKSGNDRAIGGSSSGAIAAFTAAWERPDAFSRVFSAIGTYVGLRGGNEYSTLIRKIEPKPIRIFLQDGSEDLNIYGGDWWMANQAMQRSLAFAGYEHTHVWGDGGHNGNHGTAVFPDAMRFLWKNWPQPVKAGQGAPQLKEILIPGEEWQQATEYQAFGEMAVNSLGEVLFTGPPNDKTYHYHAGGKVSEFPAPKQSDVLAFGPDQQLFVIVNEKLVSNTPKGQQKVVIKNLRGSDLIGLNNGSLYVLNNKSETGEIWHVSPQGQKRLVSDDIDHVTTVTTSPDQTLLYVNDANSHWVYSYQIQPDGSLSHGQKYYHLHVPDNADNAGAGGMCVDRDGRLYVATAMGIQVCDQAGRVNSIISVPGGAVSSVVLGGPEFDTLFAASGGKIYKRKVKTKGAPSFLPPVKPAPPRL